MPTSIALVQAKAAAGDIAANAAHHMQLVRIALRHGATLIVFPELSLTGYEPALAESLAFDAAEASGRSPLRDLQRVSDESDATILVGAPTIRQDSGEVEAKPYISMLGLSPGMPLASYSKQYLHADELSFFASAPIKPNILTLKNGSSTTTSVCVGLAICFELGVAAHAAAAFGAGADLYIASVAKHADGMASAEATLTGKLRAYNYASTDCNPVSVAKRPPSAEPRNQIRLVHNELSLPVVRRQTCQRSTMRQLCL